MHITLAIGWIAALVCSVPNFFVWQLSSQRICPSQGGLWVQCVTIWDTIVSNESASDDDRLLADVHNSQYNLAHMIMVFYGPFR